MGKFSEINLGRYWILQWENLNRCVEVADNKMGGKDRAIIAQFLAHDDLVRWLATKFEKK